MRLLAEQLAATQVPAHSHNGLHFKTICRDCNGLIGAWDAALGQLATEAEILVSQRLPFPRTVDLSLRPGAILRSILGHFVAAKLQDDQVPTDQRIREYLLGNSPLYENIKVYCWLYPSVATVVSRDFTFVQTIGAGVPSPGLISVIKFFPLAFCMVDGRGHLEVADSINFAQFSSIGPDEQCNIAVTKNHLVHLGMPELPRQDHIVLGGRTYSDSVTTVYPNERSGKSRNTRIYDTMGRRG